METESISAVQTEERLSRRARAADRRTLVAGLTAGLVWAVAVFGLLVWIWGGPHRAAFGSPDEALTEYGTRLIVEQGTPYVSAPIPDPEELFVPRLWAKRDGFAVPTHTPAPLYMLAAARRALPGGAWLQLIVPALGLGAAVAAMWLMLPRSRWMANLLPGLAFPWTFRFLKPWENMALLVSLVSIAFLLAILWRRTSRRWLFISSWLFVGLAASVRPDQVHLVVFAAVLLSLATGAGARWTWTMAAGAGAIAGIAFILGNLVITGAPLTPPVYLLESKAGAGVAGRGLPVGVSQLVTVLTPNGIPPAAAVGFHLEKYFFALGPVWFLSVGAVAATAVGGWRRRLAGDRHGLFLWGLLVALFGAYTVSRVSTTNWGAAAPEPSLGHSYPRYVSLVYVAMAVTLLYGAVRVLGPNAKRFVGFCLLVASLAGAWYLYEGELRTSLRDAVPLIHTYEEYRHAVDADLPDNAILYVRFADKFLWSVRPTALLPTEPGAHKEHLKPTALVDSLTRATKLGYAAYVMELKPSELQEADELLRARGFELREVQVGETPNVVELLLRWRTWRMVPLENSGNRPQL